MIAIAWIIFAAVILGIIVFNYGIVVYLSDPKLSRSREESSDSKLPKFVTVLGLCLIMLCLGLIPVDIYVVSDTSLSEESRNAMFDVVQILYYVLYGCILGAIFVVIPFTYFFYEEFGENVSFCRRVFAGCKYTIFLVLAAVIILIIGLFVQGGSPSTEDKDYKKYVEKIIDTENRGEAVMNFAFACAGLLGLVTWLIYTGYGFASFPVGFMKGSKDVSEEAGEVDADLVVTQERRRALQSKYMGAGAVMTRRDEASLSLLKDKERKLQGHAQHLNSAGKGCSRLYGCLRPFFFLFGFFFFIVTVILLVSMVLTNIDKLLNSECGFSCGYVLTNPKRWNPLDALLVVISKYFPMDYVVVGLVVMYIFFTTLSGVTSIGIRALWILLYRIKARATRPQGLLLATLIMMLSLVAFNLEILTLFPQYASYGSQTYKDEAGAEHDCSLAAPTELCKMTAIGTMIHRIFMRMPFFGVICYFATWVFIAFASLSLIIAALRSRQSNLNPVDEDPDWDF
jgi:LMBR1 domain-containing protein 1